MFSTFSLLRSGLKTTIRNVTFRGLRHVAQNQPVHCPKCHRVVIGTRLFSQLRTFQQHKQVSSFLRYFSPIRKTTTSAAGKVASTVPAHGEKIVGWWLMGCAGMVAGAVVLGGVTRLTESGLSMVDWRLLKDMKPPTSQKEWEEEFERYKQFPEYKYMSGHKEMTLSDFKFIYYMEYAHRMWGRGIGLFFAIPALVFLKKGWISKAMKPRLAIYASLIGFQGFLGWYMVKSGLIEKNFQEPDAIPRVSQYRLAAHLGSAIFLYTLFLYGGLMHLTKPLPMPLTKQMTRLRVATHVVLTMVVVTAMSGAFVAGLDAGLTYNSWPKMADKWIPDDLVTDRHTPKWKNIFENPTTVQFNHRHLAESTVLIVCGFWWMCRRAPLSPRARIAVNCTLGMAFVQATLGIFTLLMYVPTHLAATHQSGSVALLSFATWLAHEIKRIPK